VGAESLIRFRANQKLVNLPFANDCVECGVGKIPLDPGKNWQGTVVMTFRLEPDGSVSDWSEDSAPEGPIGALIEEQFKHGKFVAPGADMAKTAARRLTIDVKCPDLLEVSTMDGCQLTP
jgi:hypothetical protein